MSNSMPVKSKSQRWLREIGKRVLVVLILFTLWCCWQPGKEIRDGRHDRGENGLWLAHGWLGADDWFRMHGKEAEKSKYRSNESLTALAQRLKKHGITEVYPHLCPVEPNGALPATDAAATTQFLTSLPGIRVWPWVGGIVETSTLQDSAWRKRFCSSIRELLTQYPDMAGVHVNFEPLPDGTQAYLQLLDEVRAALPSPAHRISVAAYPPPTLWQRAADVHWSEPFFRAVAKRVDQLVVMTYDTSIRWQNPYRKLMGDWTMQILDWSEGRSVLLGVPAYEDAATGYHLPEVENIPNALAGINAGLMTYNGLPDSYRGICLYCDWEMDNAKWHAVEEFFTRNK